jgi:hypothetical protein
MASRASDQLGVTAHARSDPAFGIRELLLPLVVVAGTPPDHESEAASEVPSCRPEPPHERVPSVHNLRSPPGDRVGSLELAARPPPRRLLSALTWTDDHGKRDTGQRVLATPGAGSDT